MSSGLVDPNDPLLPEVERRAAVLRDLLRQSGWKVTAEVADAALAQLGIPRSTLFRAVARFRRTRRASSLLPLKRGTRDGSSLLDPRIERIIEEQIERFWLKKEKPRFSALMERVHDACYVEGLRAPHRKTIKRRGMDLNPLAAARRRGQGSLEAASTPSPGQFVADRPNAIWQIDHTIVDIVVVDEQYRRPIGRPVLTIAIDVCTRMVAGFHLALEAPSRVSVGLCLLHAVYDKTAWLSERGIDLSWPVAGLPGILHSDNGAEFHSRALTGACREYGFKIQYRPPATPRFGGHVERLIGTMMGAVHILPGTTFSKIKLKENYDAQGRAIFTLRELEAWIAIEIAGKYHHRIHSALLRPPIARWRDLQGEVNFDLPPDRMAFWTSFLPGLADIDAPEAREVERTLDYSYRPHVAIDFRAPYVEDLLRPNVDQPRMRFWIKMRSHLVDDPALHAAAFAYLSDYWINFAACIGHVRTMADADTRLYVASLNHAIWYQRALRADDWLLFDCVSPSGALGRGLSVGRVYDPAGGLVASAAQECLLAPVVPSERGT